MRHERLLTFDVINVIRYGVSVIRSFADPETERIFNRARSRKLPQGIQRVALRKLLLVDAADRMEDLRFPPGNPLEKLHGNREGQHSIRINDQWRVCFLWKDSDAFEVEIADYH
jgi:proteic killer suppression protein